MSAEDVAIAATEVAEAVAEAQETAEAVDQAMTEATPEQAAGDVVMEQVTVSETVDASGAAVKETVTETTDPSGETVTVAEVTTTEAPAAADSDTPVVIAETPAEDAANGTKAEPLDPNDPRSLPPHGTEVFVGGIPKTATEAEIRDFAAKIGEVHSVKMSYDPNNPGHHRGYGFVRYLTKENAEEAKAKLNNTKLGETEALLRVADSQSKHKLYIGNMPRAWTKAQVVEDLNKSTKGLEDIELVMLRDVPGQSRGFGFATYYNHECASAAKSVLSKDYAMAGRTLTVSFAEPRHTEQAAVVKSRAVYVGGLPPGVTEERLKTLFNKYGEVLKVVIPPVTEKRPEQKFCFIHFIEQEGADAAVAAAESEDKPSIDDKVLEVNPAKPQENKLELRQQYDPTGRGGRGGRFGLGPPIRGGRAMRGGRGPPGGRYGAGPPPAAYAPSGYDQGYGGYDQGYGAYQDPGYNAGYDPNYAAGYDQGYAGYDQYGGYAAQAPAPAAGMTMVPMMLASGQVGYVLQDQSGGQPAPQEQGWTGPDRSYGGRGRGRGPQQRYRPY